MDIMIGIYCRTSKEESMSGVATILQQIEAGVKFAKSKKLNYKIYKDEGKSGYKVDDENPFKHREGFQKLLADIANKEISDVWVWENSRLSRNTYTSAMIYRIFEKHNIGLYVLTQKYDFNNPTDKLMKNILDSFAEYERCLIVERCSRGQRNAFNNGKKRHGSFYGYTQKNKNTTADFKKLSLVKKAFDQYNKGKTLKHIANTFFKADHETTKKVSCIIKHEEYTSYQLTVEGGKIEKNFRDGKLTSLEKLKDMKYWVKSVFYTEAVISIDDWIIANERYEYRRSKHIMKDKRNDIRNTNSSLLTGFIRCKVCDTIFYFKALKHPKKKRDNSIWEVYQHLNTVPCDCRPLQISMKKADTIADVFFVIYCLLYSDSVITDIQEDTYNTKKTIEELEKEIKVLQTEVKKRNKAITNLEKQVMNENVNYELVLNLLDKANNDKEEAENQIKVIKIQIDNITKKAGSIGEKFRQRVEESLRPYAELRGLLKKYFSARELNNFQDARTILKTVIKNITFENYILTITATNDAKFIFNTKHTFDACMEKAITPFTPYSLIPSYGEIKQKPFFWDKNNIDLYLLQLKNEDNKEKLLKRFFSNYKITDDGIYLFTTSPEEAVGFKYLTTTEVCKKYNIPHTTLASWHKKYAKDEVKMIVFSDGCRRLVWSEKNIQDFLNRPNQRKSRSKKQFILDYIYMITNKIKIIALQVLSSVLAFFQSIFTLYQIKEKRRLKKELKSEKQKAIKKEKLQNEKNEAIFNFNANRDFNIELLDDSGNK